MESKYVKISGLTKKWIFFEIVEAQINALYHVVFFEVRLESSNDFRIKIPVNFNFSRGNRLKNRLN